MRYRPVLIYFETKRGDDWIDLDPLDDCDDHAQKYGAAIEIVKQVFQDNFVELYKFRQEHNDMYPTVAEMAGKVIIYYPKPDFSPDHPNATCQGRPPFKPTLIGYDGDVCIRREDVENQIQRGVQVFRVDQYQADWTFDYGVPPNPLIVDWTAMPPWSVGDSVGDEWDCDNGDVWKGQIVH